MSCVAHDDGQPCTREPAMTAPVALCDLHRVQVALAIVPDLLRDQLVSIAQPVPVDDLLGGPHDGIVYFIAHGIRVKIGFTTNLKARVNALALRADSILLALGGGMDLERALHARFDAARIDDTEWFKLTSGIRRYVADCESRTPRQVQRFRPAPVKRAAPPQRGSTEAERAALLSDLAEILGDAPRMTTREALMSLAQRSPEVYRQWTFQDLTQVLRAAGAPPGTYNGYAVVVRHAILAALGASRPE